MTVPRPSVGDRVRLEPGTAAGTVENVRGEVAEVRWDTGARCPVPISWTAPIAEIAVTRCLWCGIELHGRTDARYCSDAHRQAACRARRAAA
jgi:hypothetical protein